MNIEDKTLAQQYEKAFGAKFNIAYIHDKGFAFLGKEIVDFSANWWFSKIQEVSNEIHKLSIEDFQTYGDGHYCTHHPDDPAHGDRCYQNPAEQIIRRKLLN